ncbi:putative hydrolase or acyltransferase of alpha/beta superfamily [Spongiibacter sp. IMCC21906]|uniref:alpha/beta fold hydrolase n=1 Tax=Spongiibacter sp. IMCC21906 TaxID=1620392 RepID=UPI00062DE4A0|nr:alpha/beta hydrolase [Spongiibacter sp. IMCC21906]AKH68694.1 putative hydrolase or acyltransferase of alpha/beta superfamily [Spongiibacter sp. IMCC21906]
MQNTNNQSVPQNLEFKGKKQLKLKADRFGPSSAPTVILLHGGGQTRQSWQSTANTLANAGYCAISIDLRGHGESEWASDGDYQFESMLEDLDACCKQTGKSVILVGASIGGALSLLLAAQRPELCHGLVLVDVSPTIEIAGAQGIVNFMQAHPEGFSTLHDAQQSIAKHNPHRQQQSSQSGLKRVLRQRKDGRWVWHWDPAFIAGDWQDKVKELSASMQNAAPRITQPCLLIRGQLSTIVSMESVADLKRDIPQLDFVDIKGAGHMVAGDRNDMASAALLNFLKKLT